MILRSDTVKDENGLPVPGASVYVYDIAGADAVLTSDGTASLAQPIVTDEFGGYSYYADTGYYSEDIWYGGRRRWREHNIAIGNPGADLDLRTDLAASAGAGLLGWIYSATGSVVRTIRDRLRDTTTARDFGAIGDGVTDDTASIIAADAATGRKFVPAGTYNITLPASALNGPYWGDGQIRDSASNKRAPWFTAVRSAPTSAGDPDDIATAFNGDLSHVQIPMEHRITGTATLGQPATGYRFTPEAYPFYGYLYNTSGWNNATDGNAGRTSANFFRVKIDQYGQGDAVAFNATALVASTRAGSTHFLANPAAALFNGDALAGSDGVYLNTYETAAHDQGFDVASIGAVYRFERTNATGAKSAWWGGLRFQSEGTQPVNNLASAVGKFNGGIDLSMADIDLGANKAAMLLKSGQRIYFNASSTNNYYATTVGTDYVERSASGLDFYFNGVLSLRVNDTGVVLVKPSVSPTVTVSALPAAATGNKGMEYYVSDANATTLRSVVAGGGSNFVKVFSTGTQWLIGH